MYTEMSLLTNTKLEDTLIQEVRKRRDVHDIIPLYYDKYIIDLRIIIILIKKKFNIFFNIIKVIFIIQKI
jgi:hypothetical protein